MIMRLLHVFSKGSVCAKNEGSYRRRSTEPTLFCQMPGRVFSV